MRCQLNPLPASYWVVPIPGTNDEGEAPPPWVTKRILDEDIVPHHLGGLLLNNGRLSQVALPLDVIVLFGNGHIAAFDQDVFPVLFEIT